MKETLAIVLPAFNEEANIASTVSAVRAWMEGRGIRGEIIVVNDGSTDGTGEILRGMAPHPGPLPRGEGVSLRIITHSTNRGYGAAVRTGCDAATAKWIGFMDSDGQFDPGDFEKLLSALSPVPSPRPTGSSGRATAVGEGGYILPPSHFAKGEGQGERVFDIVVGRRRKRADPLLRKVNAKLFGILSFLVLGIWIRDINCAMKVFRREVWQRARPVVTTGALFNAEFFYNLKRQGIPWKQVDVSHYPRRGGRQTGAQLSVIVCMFREILRLRRGY